MFQMANIGRIFGQVGWFHRFDARFIDDPRAKERYVNEAQRLLGVLDNRLADRRWIMGDDYSIADIITLGRGRLLDVGEVCNW